MKLKRLGVRDGDAQKDGVAIAKSDMVAEVRRALARIDEEGAAANGVNGVAGLMGRTGI